jgi:Glyoxalase-like domain
VRAAVDHLVVAAATLAEGIRHVESRLGVEPQPGGRHEQFGTHNALLSLGPTAYLEVIAVDPDAPAPDRPRWFALDTYQVRAVLARGPALLHWVARVGSLGGVDPALHGEAMELSRGANRWALTVPADGSLPMGGVLPSLIAWHTPPPPTRLQDLGVRLSHLALATPESELLQQRLDALALADVIVVRAPVPLLKAILKTPNGPASL